MLRQILCISVLVCVCLCQQKASQGEGQSDPPNDGQCRQLIKCKREAQKSCVQQLCPRQDKGNGGNGKGKEGQGEKSTSANGNNGQGQAQGGKGKGGRSASGSREIDEKCDGEMKSFRGNVLGYAKAIRICIDDNFESITEACTIDEARDNEKGNNGQGNVGGGGRNDAGGVSAAVRAQCKQIKNICHCVKKEAMKLVSGKCCIKPYNKAFTKSVIGAYCTANNGAKPTKQVGRGHLNAKRTGSGGGGSKGGNRGNNGNNGSNGNNGKNGGNKGNNGNTGNNENTGNNGNNGNNGNSGNSGTGSSTASDNTKTKSNQGLASSGNTNAKGR